MAWLAVTALVLAVHLPAALGEPVSAPLRDGGARSGMVRVSLSSLGQPSRLDITVSGQYSVNGSSSAGVPDGTKLTVRFSQDSGELSLVYNGNTAPMGRAFKLRRHSVQGDQGLRIAQSRAPGNLYPCDLHFSVAGDAGGRRLLVVACLFIEDYLYGVLPHEIGNSSPQEALKAQAVAARTYTLRAMEASQGRLFDLVDTASDQVYSGTPASGANCRAAVDATRGIVMKTGDALTAAYYTASNGGQTESAANLWGTSGTPYLSVRDDPYDLYNPDARSLSVQVEASGPLSSETLARLLQEKADGLFFGESAAITGVSRIVPHSPKYPPPSRLYTRLDFHVRLTRDGVPGTAILSFGIFDELEKPLGLGINTASNELWSVEKTAEGFRVTARRFGHGIGMSQRGAMRMASLGYPYDKIIGFYYSGCRRVRYSFTESLLSPLVPGADSWEETTAAEAVGIGPECPSTGVVTLSGVWDSLPVYREPSYAADILTLLSEGSAVDVLSVSEGFSGIRYGSISGYVRSAWLSVSGDPSGEPPAETRLSGYAKVTAQGSLNLREGPGYDRRVIAAIPSGAVLPVFSLESGWCRVQYGLLDGYARREYLLISDSWPGSAVDPGNVLAEVLAPLGAAYMRATPEYSGLVVAVLRNGDQLEVLRSDGAWASVKKDGLPGYLPSESFRLTVQQAGPAPGETPGAGPDAAVVATSSGSLNLRAAPDAAADILRTIPRHAQVRLLTRGELWCGVEYLGTAGYAMTRYLSFLPGGGTSPSSAPQPPLSPTIGEAVVSTPSGSLNLREQPSLLSRRLTGVPRGARVAILSMGGEWTGVSYGGYSGYVMTRYLSFLPEATPAEEPAATQAGSPAQTPSPTPTPTPEAAGPLPSPDGLRDETMVLLEKPVVAAVQSDGEWLNLRRGCSEESGVVSRMPRGDSVLVTWRGERWCAAVFEGSEGFCMTQYLRFSDE